MAARSTFRPPTSCRASVQLVDERRGDRDGGRQRLAETRRVLSRGAGGDVAVVEADEPPATLVAERGTPAADASFVQVNSDVGARLHAYVLERATAHRPHVVVDAYAGSGATAIPLAQRRRARRGDRIGSRGVAHCAARLPEGSRAVAGRVEDRARRGAACRRRAHQSAAHRRARTGRGGAADRDHPPRAVIYVSCDPATLARDLARMPRYRIASLRAFDMFPQTAHVETVCELVPEATHEVSRAHRR